MERCSTSFGVLAVIVGRSSCFDITISKAAAAIEYPNGITIIALSSRRWSAARTTETASASKSAQMRPHQPPVAATAAAGVTLIHRCAQSCAGSFSQSSGILAAFKQNLAAVAWRSQGCRPHYSLVSARAPSFLQHCCGL